ncbi:MAG: cation acetate symporter [Hydrogenibacillus sp.]|nr:cation acetate symporter [Hydrogenibacillus sp.]
MLLGLSETPERVTTFVLFVAMLLSAIVITHWAAERHPSTLRFYTASRRLTGVQNGLAIAGDYISAASFLGATGAIALYGWSGLLYAIGFLASYVFLHLWIAEPVHRLGYYSLGDVFAARFPERRVRLVVAVVQFGLSFIYIIPQLVASGLLLHLLLGLDYRLGVVFIGLMMSIYVAYGGMTAASWVQILKTVLLTAGTFLIVLIAATRLGGPGVLWSLKQTLKHPLVVPKTLPEGPSAMSALLLTLFLGTSGLPHILQRMLTVGDVRAVRRSVAVASTLIAFFYLLTLSMGLSARLILPPEELVVLGNDGGNLIAPLLARALGGAFLFAFVSALAFQTVLAVVTGLVISATTALAHDVYDHVLGYGRQNEAHKLFVARLTAIVVGFTATALSIGAAGENLAVLVSLAFAAAASSFLPALIYLFYWPRLTSYGLMAGLLIGFGTSLAFGVATFAFSSPPGWLHQPGWITLLIGFGTPLVVSLWSPRRRDRDQTAWSVFFARAHGLRISDDERKGMRADRFGMSGAKGRESGAACFREEAPTKGPSAP